MQPFILLSNPHEMCVTFYWPELVSNFIGYRFSEGKPRLSKSPICQTTADYTFLGSDEHWFGEKSPLIQSYAWQRPNWLTEYQLQEPKDPRQLTFQAYQDGSARCSWQLRDGKQSAELFFRPQPDGILMELSLTSSQPLPGAFCLQQCLRFTGAMNDSWRLSIANTPFLSEFDMQAMGNANSTLTWCRHEDQWLALPVQHTVLAISNLKTDEIMQSSGNIDHGLVLRETCDRSLAPDWYFQRVAPGATWGQISSGMFWQRTVLVSNRHPADCIHAWVDFGPMAAGERRSIFGKYYFIEGSKDDLLACWQKDFSIGDI